MASHSVVAHRWAQNDKPGANLNGYGMHCAGGRVYSWGAHFIIAMFTRTKERRGKPAREVVLFNADGYSSSTAKHKSIVRRAIPSRYEVFSVPDLRDINYSSPHDGGKVLQWHVAQAAEAFAKSERARTYKQLHLDDAERHLEEAERFADAFGLKFKRPASLEAAAAKLAKEAAKKAKQEKAARKAQAERQAAEQARQREVDAIRFEEWKAGNTPYCPSSYRADANGRCYVRRSPDGESLQTSQGAEVPWDHAVKAFRFIRHVIKTGEEFHTNGRVVRVGHYKVDCIDRFGNMRAGCHSFDWADMKALAEREGVWALEPSTEAVEVTH